MFSYIGYDNSALAGYNAAMMRAQQQQPQQGAYGYGVASHMQQGYGAQGAAPSGGGYGYGQSAPAPAGGVGGRNTADQGGDQAGYGAYRGQGAAQGRADRSYRPY